jgi:lysosomal alpha-mannosidase
MTVVYKVMTQNRYTCFVVQVGKQLVAMTQLGQVGASPLDSLREAMGIMQHHDAITGTEKQHVADDYARTLAKGLEDARGVVGTAMK